MTILTKLKQFTLFGDKALTFCVANQEGLSKSCRNFTSVTNAGATGATPATKLQKLQTKLASRTLTVNEDDASALNFCPMWGICAPSRAVVRRRFWPVTRLLSGHSAWCCGYPTVHLQLPSAAFSRNRSSCCSQSQNPGMVDTAPGQGHQLLTLKSAMDVGCWNNAVSS